MCDPVSVGIAFSVMSTAVSYKASENQGDAAEATAAYNARVSENQAERQRNIGVEEENKKRRETAQLLSKQRAQLGASGVEVDSGSALQLQRDTQIIGETDALRIRNNFANSADSMNTQADLTRIEGTNAKANSRNRMAGTLLSGGATVAGKWYKNKTPTSAAPIRNAVPI